MNLRSIDLNLLVALEALLAERSVTRAAAKVGLSQPAMSAALSRLRALFGDGLLVREGRAMIPTPRASALGSALHQALEGLRRALETEPFDPRRARRRFAVACSDYPQLLLLPALLRRLSHEAPGIEVTAFAPPPGPFAATLAAGGADLAIGWAAESSPWIRERRLFAERVRCVAAADHPRVRGRMSVRQLRGERFALLVPPGAYPWSVDELLRERGIERRCPLTVSTYLVEPHVVAASDLLALVPQRLGETFARLLPLRVLELPLRLPAAEFRMLWHARHDDDAGHRWFRQLVSDVLGS